MSNTLGVFNPIFYAQEALIQLEKALGMAGRVHRGYEAERRGYRRGETISIPRPSSFTAADAPSTAQALDTGSVDITLAYWKEVKFALTDKELAFTSEKIITDHIRPAAYALADDIDQKLCALYADIPWFVDLNSTIAIDDVTDVRQKLFDNKVPLGDPSMVHYMVNGAVENGLLQLAAFSQNQGAGQTGVETQMRGTLGTKYGMEIFANQNVKTHTSGTSADATGAIVGTGADKGVSTIDIDGVTAGGTFKKGDTLVIAGNTQRYAITADVTATDGSCTLSITPPLVQDYDNDTVVTIDLTGNTKAMNMAWHRNAFALVVAPLPEMGNELGARIATVTDPRTALSIRSRIFYIGDSSEVRVALDVLYGVKTLNPNLATRAHK